MKFCITNPVVKKYYINLTFHIKNYAEIALSFYPPFHGILVLLLF